MNKKIVVGNFKMNLSIHSASILLANLNKHIAYHRNMDIILAPGYLCIAPLSLEINKRKFKLGSQDGYFIDQGSFTGQVSFSQLRGLVDYAIIGHSERRINFNDNLVTVRKKVAAAIRNNIKVILAVGETTHERNAHETKQVLHDQIVTALADLTPDQVMESVYIAYEPVWAIGGHQPASNKDIESALSWCKAQIKDLYGNQAMDRVAMLYGGSIEVDNVKTIMQIPNLDGLLVGHASLNYLEFSNIVNQVFNQSIQDKNNSLETIT